MVRTGKIEQSQDTTPPTTTATYLPKVHYTTSAPLSTDPIEIPD
jgi:hypothetical protein